MNAAGGSTPLERATRENLSSLSSIKGMVRGISIHREGVSLIPRGPPSVSGSAATQLESSKSLLSHPHGYFAPSTSSPGPGTR